jgi:hypothetical protein
MEGREVGGLYVSLPNPGLCRRIIRGSVMIWRDVRLQGRSRLMRLIKGDCDDDYQDEVH